MKLVVGLGNPGRKYKGSRHNVGFAVADALALQMANSKWLIVKKFQSSVIRHQASIILAKPQTFMNRSGEAVRKIISNFQSPISNLYVIHDDLDIRLGRYKIQFGKGPRQHNGLQSIYDQLGSKNFWHIRIGVEQRAKGIELRMPGEEYVLQRFTEEEQEIIEQVVLEVVSELRERLKRKSL